MYKLQDVLNPSPFISYMKKQVTKTGQKHRISTLENNIAQPRTMEASSPVPSQRLHQTMTGS